MKTYKYVIFDVDDTLLDFGSAFQVAQKDIANKLGIDYSQEYINLDEKCGWKAWKESGLDDTNSSDVQENYHTYYFKYLELHYLYLMQALGMTFNANELVDCYINSISSSKTLMETNTLQVFIELAQHYKLVLATNGIEKIQKERISSFLPYTHRTYISQTIKSIKPSKKFFDYVFQDLGCNPHECLMIGDSISNDILGAKSIGMDVCFYNPKKKGKPNDIMIDYEINNIHALLQILI